MLSRFIAAVFVIIVLVMSAGCRDASSPSEPIDVKAITKPTNLQITILSPMLGDKFQPGNNCTIVWKSPVEIAGVNIDLYKKTEFRQHLAVKLTNTGEFQWNIPSDIVQSHHYRVKITNSGNEKEYSYSEVFYVLSF